MAELANGCCSTEARQTCCEPEEKVQCCAQVGNCGCAEGTPELTSAEALRESVRERYAAVAICISSGDTQDATDGCGCGAENSPRPERGAEVFGGSLYAGADTNGASFDALSTSLGCGVPTAVAELKEGETVLDLGSGAGADVLIGARRVGPSGKAIGVDMTDEMLRLARRNAAEVGVTNVELLKGHIEDIPLPDASTDVVISDCVINLSADKDAVLREAARVLRPGGRLAVSDVIADAHMDKATRDDMRQWTGCVAGALTSDRYRAALRAAGFADIQVTESHRVHERAVSAVIKARTPSAPQLSAPETSPVAPSCALDQAGLQLQLERYRQLGAGAQVIEKTRRRVAIALARNIDVELVEETLATEQECCPFFSFDWGPARRRLTASVSRAAHEPALNAIAHALDVESPLRWTPPD